MKRRSETKAFINENQPNFDKNGRYIKKGSSPMKQIDQRNSAYAIQIIKEYFTLEQLSELIKTIAKSPYDFIETLVKNPSNTPNQLEKELLQTQSEDLCNMKVQDYINLVYTKGGNIAQELINIYKTITKDLGIPTIEYITTKLKTKTITFNHPTKEPLAQITLTQEKAVSIKAKNNKLEFLINTNP